MHKLANWIPIFLCLFLGCQKKNSKEKTEPASISSGLEVKDRLGEGMNFPHVTVADQLGSRYDLYNLLNKPNNIVLLIDATCPACADEGKMIQNFLHGNTAANLVGVSPDSLPAILEFKKKNGIFFPVLQDIEQKLVPDYRRVVFPTLVLVGPGRQIQKLYEGAIPPEEAELFLRALLGLN